MEPNKTTKKHTAKNWQFRPLTGEQQKQLASQSTLPAIKAAAGIQPTDRGYRFQFAKKIPAWELLTEEQQLTAIKAFLVITGVPFL